MSDKEKIQKELDDLNSEISGAKATLSDLLSAINKTKLEQQEIDDSKKQSDKAYKVILDKNAILLDSINTTEDRLKEKQRKLESINEKISEAKGIQMQSDNRLLDTNIAYTEASDKLSLLKIEIKKKEEQLDKDASVMKESLKNDIDGLSIHVADLKEQINTSNIELSDIRREKNRLQDDITVLKSNKESLTDEKINLNDALIAIDNEIIDQREKLKIIKDNINKAEKAKADILAATDKVSADLIEAEKTLEMTMKTAGNLALKKQYIEQQEEYLRKLYSSIGLTYQEYASN